MVKVVKCVIDIIGSLIVEVGMGMGKIFVYFVLVLLSDGKVIVFIGIKNL